MNDFDSVANSDAFSDLDKAYTILEQQSQEDKLDSEPP